MLRKWQRESDGVVINLDVLIEENELLRKAVLDIKKHQEAIASTIFLGKPMYETSVAWNIANNTLNKLGCQNETF